MSKKHQVSNESNHLGGEHTPGAAIAPQARSVDSEFDLTSRRATYESLVNTLPLCLLIKDAQGRRLFANKAYLDWHGKKLDEVVGKVDADLFPADIARLYTNDDQRVLIDGETLHSVEQTCDDSGVCGWIERIKSPIRNDAGKITGLQLVFWDVTDRIRAEEELNFERHLLATLLKNLPDCIYFKDRDSRFIRISDAMAEKFGFDSPEHVVGKTDADIFTKEHAEGARKDELHIMESGESVVDQIEKETWPDRADTWCISTKMAFRDDDDRLIGTFGISRDITELVESQRALQEARERADKANRAKSEFLANMSHEIRTPMNAITGMSELLSQTTLTNEQRDYVDLVRESSDALLRLLNDILDFSRIEARKLEIESAPFVIRDLVEKTARSLSIRADEKQLELTCRISPDIPDRLVGDAGRLRQVLINLVGNGIKFTDQGQVSIDVMRDPAARADDSDKATILFQVSDTGMGIPREKQTAVLQAFTQADASTTRRFGGTGLGLAICRELVKLMGGSLWLESEPNAGATFAFSLPFKVAPTVEESPQKRLTSLVDMPVLVVDDNSVNRRILDEVFTRWRLKPTLASSGPDALQKIEAADALGQPFQLAVLDCMMPDMDGFELAERIRVAHDTDDLKLIVLSSATRSDDANRCAQVGVERYMTKPVVQSELLDTVLQVMGVEKHEISAPVNTIPSCPPMRVLVAEDGLANQHVAIGLLKFAGHQATIASDGKEAVSRWREGDFDAILMDVHMPEMDGLEATRLIRTEEEQSGGHIPIIALTAAAMEEDAQACRAAGMDDYLTKPIHPRSLQLMLLKHAPHQELAAAPLVAKSPAQTEAELRGEASDGAQETEIVAEKTVAPALLKDVIDLQAAVERIAGGVDGVLRLSQIFKTEAETLIVQMRDAVESNQAAELHRAAHTLKGSANLFVAKRMSSLAFDIEQRAKVGELSEIRPRIAQLEEEMRVFFNAIDQLKTDADQTA